jgi:hypothetical protein
MGAYNSEKVEAEKEKEEPKEEANRATASKKERIP